MNPKLQDGRRVFDSEFSGMALIPVTYEELERVREKLIETVKKGLTQNERQFLITFKEGKPEWGLLGIEGVEKLPAVQWKLANLERMDRKKHSQAVNALKKVLGL